MCKVVSCCRSPGLLPRAVRVSCITGGGAARAHAILAVRPLPVRPFAFVPPALLVIWIESHILTSILLGMYVYPSPLTDGSGADC